MKHCDDIRSRVAFYLDDELRGDELAGFEGHLKTCEACVKLVENERRFIESIRQLRPLYPADQELRERVERILENAPAPYAAPPELRKRVQKSISRASRTRFQLNTRRRAAVALTAVVAVVLSSIWLAARHTQSEHNAPSEFALMAVDTHLRHLRGQLPFEIASESPEIISHWFTGKVSFVLSLPTYQESSGQEKLYRLEGARLVGFKNDYAAYVAYQMSRRPISLVVTSERVATPS